jgi:hypothetical protein
MTSEDIIRIAEECGIPEFENNESQADNILRFATLVSAAEREACAKVCERLADMVSNNNWVAIENRKLCATEIRKGEMK